jgi:hypothetical protein
MQCSKQQMMFASNLMAAGWVTLLVIGTGELTQAVTLIVNGVSGPSTSCDHTFARRLNECLLTDRGTSQMKSRSELRFTILCEQFQRSGDSCCYRAWLSTSLYPSILL